VRHLRHTRHTRYVMRHTRHVMQDISSADYQHTTHLTDTHQPPLPLTQIPLHFDMAHLRPKMLRQLERMFGVTIILSSSSPAAGARPQSLVLKVDAANTACEDVLAIAKVAVMEFLEDSNATARHINEVEMMEKVCVCVCLCVCVNFVALVVCCSV